MTSVPASVASIRAIDLRRRLEQSEVLVILDVREDDERAFCSLPIPANAIHLHVPMGSIPSQFESIRDASRSRPIVVYCHLGMRSMAVAQWLAGRGVQDVHNLEGGIDAWSTEVDPSLPRY
jgi:rhodanese-related sulfurtransferase